MGPLHAIIKKICFPLHPLLTRAHCHYGKFQLFNMTVLKLPYNLYSKIYMFTAYINNLYTTNLQEGIQTCLDNLFGTSHQQEPIVTTAHTQIFHISNMSVPKHPNQHLLPRIDFFNYEVT